MSDVRKALEAAQLEYERWSGESEGADEAARDVILAFLRAMPDASRFSEIMIDGEKAGEIRLPNIPSTLAAAIEKETP